MDFSLPQLVLLLLFLPLLTYCIFQKTFANKASVHGLKPYPVIGVLPQFIRNRHRFLDWVTEILLQSPSRTMSFQGIGQIGGVITANPVNVEYMLKTNFENFPKGERSIKMLEDFLGHGIFNSDGEDWKWQRKAASYEFNKRSLRNFVVETVEHEISKRLVPLLKKAAENNETLDLQDVFERFGFDNICKVAFNEDPGCLTEESMSKFFEAFDDAQEHAVGRFMDAFKMTWKIKKYFNIGTERKLKESISIVHNYAMNIIKARKEKNLEEYHDLLSRFAENGDHSDEFLRDTVVSFLLAGRETTSSSLTWFFWILSNRPDVREKIIKEVKRVGGGSDKVTFSYDELREMNYLHAAVTESMRLYPPVPTDSQSCLNGDTLPDGTFVGKGWFVTYSAYTMGRLEDIWGKDCNEFKPERWLENGVFKPESPFRYPVFHAGPRMCLGKEMAYIQMKSVVACILQRFELDVIDKKGSPEYVFSLTLRMKGGLPIKVKQI